MSLSLPEIQPNYKPMRLSEVPSPSKKRGSKIYNDHENNWKDVGPNVVGIKQDGLNCFILTPFVRSVISQDSFYKLPFASKLS